MKKENFLEKFLESKQNIAQWNDYILLLEIDKRSGKAYSKRIKLRSFWEKAVILLRVEHQEDIFRGNSDKLSSWYAFTESLIISVIKNGWFVGANEPV